MMTYTNSNWLILGIILFLLACNPDDYKTGGHSNQAVKRIAYRILDSIPLFNDSLSFRFVNLQKIEKDSILAFQYPALNLSLLDGRGNFVREIGRKGEARGQFYSQVIWPYFGEDGRLYVVEQGNAPRLCIFDRQLNFVKSIALANRMGLHYLPSLETQAYIDQNQQVLLSAGSLVYHRHQQELYEKDSSLLFVQLNKDLTFKRAESKLAYQDYQSIEEALIKNRKSWNSPIALFQVSGDQLFVKYEFDHKIYQYHYPSFDLQKEIDINPAYTSYNYATEFVRIEDVEENIASSYRLRYSNVAYHALALSGDKIFLTYNKPVAISKAPRTPDEEFEFKNTTVIQIKDLNSEREYALELPPRFSPYNKPFPVSEDELYVKGNEHLAEDIYLYKIKLIYDASEASL